MVRIGLRHHGLFPLLKKIRVAGGPAKSGRLEVVILSGAQGGVSRLSRLLGREAEPEYRNENESRRRPGYFSHDPSSLWTIAPQATAGTVLNNKSFSAAKATSPEVLFQKLRRGQTGHFLLFLPGLPVRAASGVHAG
jgi:hypothetical protein